MPQNRSTCPNNCGVQHENGIPTRTNCARYREPAMAGAQASSAAMSLPSRDERDEDFEAHELLGMSEDDYYDLRDNCEESYAEVSTEMSHWLSDDNSMDDEPYMDPDDNAAYHEWKNSLVDEHDVPPVAIYKGRAIAGKEIDYTTMSDECRERLSEDMSGFLDQIAHTDGGPEALREYLDNREEDDFAYDFYLTRNGHGTGFWDRGLSEEASTILTDASKNWGESDDPSPEDFDGVASIASAYPRNDEMFRDGAVGVRRADIPIPMGERDFFDNEEVYDLLADAQRRSPDMTMTVDEMPDSRRQVMGRDPGPVFPTYVAKFRRTTPDGRIKTFEFPQQFGIMHQGDRSLSEEERGHMLNAGAFVGNIYPDSDPEVSYEDYLPDREENCTRQQRSQASATAFAVTDQARRFKDFLSDD